LAFSVFPLTLRAEEVVVFVAERGPIAEKILAGFRKTLSVPSREVFEEGALWQALSSGAKVVVAVGASSADKLRIASSLPLVVTGVPNLYDRQWGRCAKVHLGMPHEAQLKALKEIFPKGRRIATVYYPGKSTALLADARRAASEEGLEFHAEECASSQELVSALNKFKGHVDVFWIIMDPVAASPTSYNLISQFCLSEKIFLLAPAEPHVQMGASMALVAKYEDVGVLTGEAVLDVLKGAGRDQYFVKEPQLFLNRANLSFLGLSIPESVRVKAKKIY